jgi:hypothetical protein
VSHEGEGRRSASGMPGVPGVMTFGAAAAGEMLSDRYRLEEHVDTDAGGRQIWRAIDTVLRRPVAVVIRQPGGEAAAGMLTAALALSRLVHPHMVSVYDAIDEGDRAYLVREWVPGVALRDILRQAPLDSERATLVTHAISEAVAALHSAGIVHGNIHPGTILIADDGRVVLADAHADNQADGESDIRAVGAVLYACLTGHWPYIEAGRSALPDAVRDAAGRLATPRQVRGGIPRHLDEIAADLLDPRTEPPAAQPLAAEFARLATQGLDEPDYDDDLDAGGPMGFGHSDGGGKRQAGGKLALGVAVLTVIAVAGAFIGVRIFGSADPGPTTPTNVTQSPSGTVAAPGSGKPIALTANMIRLVDPPKGDRSPTEFEGFEKMVDGSETSGWSCDEYTRANFGALKPGMGVLINLGAPTKVGAVKVVVGQQGASLGLRTGPGDPGASLEGDDQIAKTFTPIGQALDDHSGTVMVLPVPPDQQVQYLLVWITKLPVDSKGKFTITVNEISVLAP